jgi:hypothetical protein
VDIRRGDYNAANYIGKWGLHDEMTKSHVKRGKGSENKTAFDLLRASLSGDVSAGEKFREHAAAFSGRRQLVWTRGLRELLSLGVEKSDAETANADEGAVEEIATIGPSDWSRVLRHDMRAAVLLAAEKGAESLAILLRELSFFDSRMKRCFAWRN